ncbi:BnaA07g02950D [Brassica napus]|uniref:BnaA07g02950D protein n=1 Tax=Brassica napus TaxID=3708 RepID=A0A078GCZ5_BRANA|nr:BnaA07g02950D [Brassica napus]
MSHLPMDIVEEILFRVPAISLKRLGSTCKRWKSLFKDHRFTDKHFLKAAKQSLVLRFSGYTQATPMVAGAAVAAAAIAGRYGIHSWQAFKARPIVPRMRMFYEGGFQAALTRREAALILGVRERVVAEKVKEAHRRVMVANHPDAGGSHYLAS